MRIHVLQVGYDDDEGIEVRRKRVAHLVAEQGEADLVVLPELWPQGGFAYRGWAGLAEPADGPTLEALAGAARAAGAVVHAGSIVERAAADADQGPTGRGLWNTSLVIGPDGALLGTYRKVHRFGFGAGEPVLMEAGESVVTLELPLGPGGAPITTGLATCYDLRFPELFRALVDRGVEMVVVPAAWPASRVEHWDLLTRARAVENQVVLVGAGTAGTHARTSMAGHSVVVDARGRVLALAGDHEQVLTAEVDLADVATWREQFPVLADRRL